MKNDLKSHSGQMSSNTDRRIQRTRAALQKAVIELILEKGYEALTVKEIAERADVNHATFYLHYKNKEQLLEITLGETIEALAQQLEQDKRCCIDSKQAIVQIFDHVACHANIYRVLLSMNGGVHSIVTQTRNHIASIVKRQLLTLAPYPGGIPYDVIAQHTAGALLAVVSWWLENDMAYSPNIIAEMTSQLSAPSMLIGLGLGFQST